MSTQPASAAAPAVASTTLSISQQIAEFAANLTADAIPADVRECAKLHVLDVAGTALAATRFDFAQHALAGIMNLAEGGNNSVIGMNVKLPMRDAVLMNGILAHGLDYDDTHPGAIVHPTASAFPCSLGVAEKRDASGADLLMAYILGVEIATRLGVAAAGTMHTQGFHTTGIAGHFGVVRACISDDTPYNSRLPFLISRACLRGLGAVIDTDTPSILFKQIGNASTKLSERHEKLVLQHVEFHKKITIMKVSNQHNI